MPLPRWTRLLGPEVQRAAANTLSQLGNRGLALAAGVATSALIGRHLGPSGYGQFVFVVTYLGFFGPIVVAGLDHIAVRELALEQDELRQVLPSVLTLKILLAAGAGVLAIVLLPVADAGRASWLGVVVAAPTLLASALAGQGLVLHARQRLDLRTIGETVVPISFLILAAGLIASGAGVVPLLAG